MGWTPTGDGSTLLVGQILGPELVLPRRFPNTDSERVVQTIQQECLDHFVVFGEKRLNDVVNELGDRGGGCLRRRAARPLARLEPIFPPRRRGVNWRDRIWFSKRLPHIIPPNAPFHGINMAANVRELHCKHVSTTEGGGEYFQVMFATMQDSDEEYLIVQRQFEMPDGGECYVETDDRNFCGHFRLRNARLTSKQFQFEFGSGPTRMINVSFEVTESAYAEAKRVLQIMIPDLESVRAAGFPDGTAL